MKYVYLFYPFIFNCISSIMPSNIAVTFQNIGIEIQNIEIFLKYFNNRTLEVGKETKKKLKYN